MFDREYYYDTRGAAWGNADLFEYWRTIGFAAGDRASRAFWMQDYRRRHPWLPGSDRNVLNHWLEHGRYEGRYPGP